MSKDQNTGPACRLRENALSAEVWENQQKDGVQHNVTFSRSYRDKEGNWKSTNSFGERDLLSLQHLAGRAHDAIRERRTEMRAQQRPKDRSRDRDQSRER